MRLWHAMRPYLICAGIVSGYLLASEIDDRQMRRNEETRLALLSRACGQQMRSLVVDERGNYLCAPQLLLSMPVGK